MPDEWFVERKTGISGPYTAGKLKALAAEGVVSPSDLIRKGADGKPLAAARVKGLFDTRGDQRTTRTSPPRADLLRRNQDERSAVDSPQPPSPQSLEEPPKSQSRRKRVIDLLKTDIQSGTGRKWFDKVVGVATVFLFLFFGMTIVVLVWRRLPHSEPHAGIPIAAETLVAEYERDKDAATYKYDGKVLEITGTVKDAGEQWIVLKGTTERSIECTVPDGNGRPSQGQTVTVRGTCTCPKFGSPGMVRCVMVATQDAPKEPGWFTSSAFNEGYEHGKEDGSKVAQTYYVLGRVLDSEDVKSEVHNFRHMKDETGIDFRPGAHPSSDSDYWQGYEEGYKKGLGKRFSP